MLNSSSSSSDGDCSTSGLMIRSNEERQLHQRQQSRNEDTDLNKMDQIKCELVKHEQQFQPHQQQQQQQQAQQPTNQQQQAKQQTQQYNSYEQQDDCNNRPKRNPYCSRCRNHGKSAQVKGHKRHCEYRDCQCEGCKLVECRQIVSAAQIKRRRYQKQDEECGRRIEISPPVLHREPNNDPATLIAKTLIGSANAKHLQQQTAVHKQLNATTAGPIPANHHQVQVQGHHHHQQSPFITGNSNLQHHHHHHHNPLQQAQSQLVGPSNNLHQQSQQSLLPGPPHLNLNQLATTINNHSPQLHQQQQQQQQQAAASSSSAAATSALSNALHLFHFPNLVLSAAAAASFDSHSLQSSVMGGSSSPSSHLGCGSNGTANAQILGALSQASGGGGGISLSPLPSTREQITLVEEIHQAFGPLAIYAWLRSERFDLQKVRDLIELSRVSFDELLQVTGHSPLDLTSPIVD